MKITLRFEPNDSPAYPCSCLIYRESEATPFVCSISKTWAEAEAEAIAKAKAQLNAGEPPQPKEILI